MATRIESGQMQIRSVGSVPMAQVQQQGVDYIGPRVAAQGSSQLAQILDRMSASAFKSAAETRQEEGIQYVVDNPPSTQQLNAAKNGDPTSLVPSGNFSYFEKAVRKARSIELASEFNIEMSNVANNIALEVQQGSITAEQARDKLTNAQGGMSKSLAQIDPEATLKFRATSAMHGNTIINEAYKVQLQKEKTKQKIKLDLFYDNQMLHLQSVIEQGSWKDSTGQERSIDEKVEVIRTTISDAAISIGDAAVQEKFSEKFKNDLRNAKVNSVTKLLMTDAYMDDPGLTLKKIEAGDIGTLSPVLQSMLANDYDSVRKVTANFRVAVEARKQGIEFNLAASQRKGDVLLRQIYSSKSPTEQNNLFSQLTLLPVSPENIKTARAFITDQAKEGRANDDFTALGLVSRRVALGLATQSEINNGPFTNSTKRELTRALANPSDDINYATKQISLAVGIQSANLPPELKSAEARQLAVQTSNDLAVQLYQFVSTPNEKGVLPTPTEVRKRGDDLAGQAKSQMSGAFGKVAESNQRSAVLQLPELKGVDLTNTQAVDAAFAAATRRGAYASSINAARGSVEDYRTNIRKEQEGKK